MTPASIIPVFGSQRPYADLNFAAGSFGLNGTSVSSLALLAGFTFTRASLAMMFDATGTLVYGPNNLCLQSQTFGTTWSQNNVTVASNAVAAPDGTLTADTIIETVAAGAHQVFQTLTGNGSGAIWSCYAKAAGRDWIALTSVNVAGTLRTTYFNISTGVVGTVGAGVTATITDAGNGWYRCAVCMPSAFAGSYSSRIYLCDADGSTSYTGNGVSGAYLWGAQLEAVTYQTIPSTYYPTTTAAYYGPRLVYDPVTLASQGILVEEARTNLALQSQTFDSATWTKQRSSVTANTVTSPDGTTNADKLVEDATAANSHGISQVITTTAASVYTISVFLKAAERTFASVYASGPNVGIYVNLTTGAFAGNFIGAPTSYTITNAGNGWWRVAIVFTAVGASTTLAVYSANATPDYVYDGNGTSGIYLFQAGLELGQGASSPIPTTTASVTRAADVATVTGLNMPYPLSMVSTFQRDWDAGTAQIVAQVDAGSNSQRAYLLVNASDLFAAAAAGGSVTGNTSVSGATTPGVAYVGAMRALTDDFVAARDGALSVVDTNFGYPTTATTLRIGGESGGAYLNGTISRIRVYKRAFTDAELQAITL